MYFCLVTESVSGESREEEVAANLPPGINHVGDVALSTPQVFVAVIAPLVGLSFCRVPKGTSFSLC